MVLENYKKVRNEVDEVCRKAGRDPGEVLLLPVSKTKPVEMIRELYDAGVRDFGENYVQELRAKQEELPKDIRWHMIGHLQRNKVKYIAPFIHLIHSVDTVELARTIDKEAAKCGRTIPILIEVNAGGEESKFGLTVSGVPAFLEELKDLAHIEVRGFMTSAPYVSDPETIRFVFRDLYKLSLDTSLKNNNNVLSDILSMGMSNDYHVAIEEGATIVRIGTDIFGARDYSH